MRSDHPAHRSFWVSIKKCTSHFDPLEPEKRPKRPVFGHQRKKPNRRLRWHRNFGRFGTHLYPVALFVSELRPVFRRESVFTPDEYVFTGLVVRMYRFDVTACAEARRLDKKMTKNEFCHTQGRDVSGRIFFETGDVDLSP